MSQHFRQTDALHGGIPRPPRFARIRIGSDRRNFCVQANELEGLAGKLIPGARASVGQVHKAAGPVA